MPDTQPDGPDPRHLEFDSLRADQPVFRHAESRTFILTRMADARSWLNDASQWRDADRGRTRRLVHALPSRRT